MASPVTIDSPLSDQDTFYKEHPKKVSFEEVSAAAYRIQSGAEKTTCTHSHLGQTYGMDIYFKNEFTLHTGCFKERGARNALLLLTPEEKKRGIIAASTGNYSQGICYHAQMLNVPATVVMPIHAPLMKIQNCRTYGAEVIVEGNNMQEAKAYAMKLASERGLNYISGYDHPNVIAGHGTVGLEIFEQVPDLDAVLVPTGGGSLLAGVATAIKHLNPEVLIYGVESENFPSMTEAMKNGSPLTIESCVTLADGLAVPCVGFNSFQTAKGIVNKMITVNEDWIARAILKLIEREKFVVEGAGAVGLAAIMAGLVPELAGKKVVCILTGGNIETTLLGRCLDRGLAAEHRLIKFKVTLADTPGSFTKLSNIVSSLGVSMKDIFQERAWIYSDIFSVRVKVVCETSGPEHTDQLCKALSKNYDEWNLTKKYDTIDGPTQSSDDGEGY